MLSCYLKVIYGTFSVFLDNFLIDSLTVVVPCVAKISLKLHDYSRVILIFSSYVGLDPASTVYPQNTIWDIRHTQKIFEN